MVLDLAETDNISEKYNSIIEFWDVQWLLMDGEIAFMIVTRETGKENNTVEGAALVTSVIPKWR